MIKYFYVEETTNSEIIRCEVLNEKPKTYVYGFMSDYGDVIYKFWVDVEKYVDYNGELCDDFQKAYDKLLIEQRELKLDTLLE